LGVSVFSMGMGARRAAGISGSTGFGCPAGGAKGVAVVLLLSAATTGREASPIATGVATLIRYASYAPTISIVAMTAAANWPGLSKRLPAGNADVANPGGVMLAAVATPSVVAGAGAESAAGNLGVAPGVLDGTGYAAPHL
jgi:hypothetical protein